jgi:hypothetical protein
MARCHTEDLLMDVQETCCQYHACMSDAVDGVA